MKGSKERPPEGTVYTKILMALWTPRSTWRTWWNFLLTRTWSWMTGLPLMLWTSTTEQEQLIPQFLPRMIHWLPSNDNFHQKMSKCLKLQDMQWWKLSSHVWRSKVWVSLAGWSQLQEAHQTKCSRIYFQSFWMDWEYHKCKNLLIFRSKTKKNLNVYLGWKSLPNKWWRPFPQDLQKYMF